MKSAGSSGGFSKDRNLVLIALIILLISSGALFFDGWMWGGRSKKGDNIGFVTVRRGDVRFRYDGDLKWQKAARGQEVMYNDAVFVGPDSSAELAIGEGSMTVTENSMVVIRREDNANFVRLRFGSVFGELGSNEKMVVDTGDGKSVEFTAKSNVRLMIKKTGLKTELEVISGTGSILSDGKISQIENSTRVAMQENKPNVIQVIPLEIVRPLRGQTVYSHLPHLYEFLWKWKDGHEVTQEEVFEVEFSTQANFEKILAIKRVQGKRETTLLASRSTRLFFRVRGPQNQLTTVEAVDFVRTEAPQVESPLPMSQWISDPGERGNVSFKFKPSDTDKNIWWQVSRDVQFKDIEVNVDSIQTEFVKELTPGEYYVRARTNYGNKNLGPWSPSSQFVVSERVRSQNMPTLSKKYLIPNFNYPSALYRAPVSVVQNYLERKGVLRNYFEYLRQSYDELVITTSEPDKRTFVATNRAWPKTMVYPQKYRYTFQLKKSGFIASDRSEESQLEIAMAPPKISKEPEYGDTIENIGQVRIPFTPILFAHKYQIEIGVDPSFTDAYVIETKQPMLKAQVNTRVTTFWHVRALDKDERPISDFSEMGVILPDTSVPAALAANDERDPAATEQSVLRPEDLVDDRYIRSSFWAWIGAGANFTDYRQSIPGRGEMHFNNLVNGSKYFEAGYSKKGLGGVVTFKETPGKVIVDNASIDRDRYTWSHWSIEGQVRKRTPITLFGRPVIVGLRAGVQHHRMPFIFLNAAQSLEQKSMSVNSASGGGLIQWSRANWNYYWLLRYQFPFSATADGSSQFQIDPVFAFDGSMGVAYDITRQLKAGAFWYGQWHQFDFTYSDGSQTNNGFQSLFYSTFDLRLGFQF